MEENKQEEVLKVILDRMNQEDVWFTSKDDDVYGSAKNLFKLDEYGDLNDKSKERLINEVEDLLGDGATYLIEAVDQWIEDNLIQGTISYKDNLHMNYTPKEISEEVTAYQEKGVKDLELGTLDEKGNEKKLEEGKKYDTMAFAQLLPMSFTDYVDNEIYDFVEEDEDDCTPEEIAEYFIDNFKGDLDEEDAEDFNDDLAIEYIKYKLDGMNKQEESKKVESFKVNWEYKDKRGNIKQASKGRFYTTEEASKFIDELKQSDDKKPISEPEIIFESKKVTESVSKDNLIKAMDALGYYYDDIASYDGYIKFNDMEGFNSWDDVQEYLELLVIDDPDISDQVENLLKESKRIIESTARLYQMEAVDANHGKLFARYSEMDSINLNDYKEVASIDVRDGMSDDEALDYIFTLGNTNQDLRDANPEMRSISVSDVVLLNGKYYYCDAFGWKEASEKLVECKKVTESNGIEGRFLTWYITGQLYILETTYNNKVSKDAKKFLDAYIQNQGIDISKFDEETIKRTLGQIQNDMEFTDLSTSDDGKALFYHSKYNGGTAYSDSIVWVSEPKVNLTEEKLTELSDSLSTFEVRTNFRIQISGRNSLGDDYIDDDNSVELLDRYPEIEPDELFDKANKMLKGEDLAKYLPEELENVIQSIKLHFEPYELVAVIKAPASFNENDELKEKLASYLEGQYSDGWGESFEQMPIMEIGGFEDDQYEEVTANIFIQPMVRYERARVSLAEKKTLKDNKGVNRKRVVEVITDPDLGKDGLPKLPDPYEMQYRFQDDLYQIVNKGPGGIEDYCYAISDEDSYSGTWSIYGKSDEGIIDYEDGVEDYLKCVKLLSKFDDVALQENLKLHESSDKSKRKRLNEENQKSVEVINSAMSAKDFDSESPAGKIISRTKNLFDTLSEEGYDVQVTLDNGESQSSVLLGNLGGKVIVTINNADKPLQAFVSGNFELTLDNFNMLNDIQDIVSTI